MVPLDHPQISYARSGGESWPMGIFQDRIIVRSEIAMLLCPICIGLAILGATYLAWGNGAINAMQGALEVFAILILLTAVPWGWRTRSNFPLLPDPQARIQIIGGRFRLPWVASNPVAISEPDLFLLSFAMPKRSWTTGMGIAIVCLIVFAALYAVWPVDRFPVRTALGASATVLVLISLFAWPAYARVSPSRLDLFQCGFLGRNMKLVRSIDLSAATIRIDLSRRRVFFKEPGSRLVWIDTGFSRFRLSLERAIIAASMSTEQPQLLPNDSLSG